jgi:hypothetical protein
MLVAVLEGLMLSSMDNQAQPPSHQFPALSCITHRHKHNRPNGQHLETHRARHEETPALASMLPSALIPSATPYHVRTTLPDIECQYPTVPLDVLHSSLHPPGTGSGDRSHTPSTVFVDDMHVIYVSAKRHRDRHDRMLQRNVGPGVSPPHMAASCQFVSSHPPPTREKVLSSVRARPFSDKLVPRSGMSGTGEPPKSPR